MTGTRESCTCDRCVAACKRHPGWLEPGDAERIAAHLGVSLPDLFRSKLAVDYMLPTDANGLEDAVFGLRPVTPRDTPGAEAPYVVGGRCVFLSDDDRCTVHPVKPAECRDMLHGEHGEHERFMTYWSAPEPRAQIVALLEREPEAPMPTPVDAFEMLAATLEAYAPPGGQ